MERVHIYSRVPYGSSLPFRYGHELSESGYVDVDLHRSSINPDIDALGLATELINYGPAQPTVHIRHGHGIKFGDVLRYNDMWFAVSTGYDWIDNPIRVLENYSRPMREDGWKAWELGCKLTKNEWVIIFDKPFTLWGPARLQITCWGPDELRIKVPPKYSREGFAAALKVCLYCDAADTHTRAVGLDGRCCDKCLPAQKKRQEYPGWYGDD